ncbi:AcrR family transcriptional regulator [Enterococcus sp. PF1-24]|uniref:TetR/AcrR family transcriptional regulator n=1 Tax=unclassified Enterococcus TaxID=2608891 RepID=UPI0024755EBC|nr:MULTISPECIES: TetR/AcrR family transcriptional regulator [unclassified Enterococcus]MDH6365307.1 AcrR family transcriptional regulator [Enterococcus sp. PFB1-1]MDH6402437.1 AcrR family transcriptional regulator [Enterococcus sp. PF1-24]
MARRKTITREQILKAAYEIVATEGFSKFTARNIAHKMKCSTQPIYLEFENMQELKDVLLDKLYDQLANKYFTQEYTGKPVLDLVLSYIHFAKEHKQLYRALYFEESGEDNRMSRFSEDYFRNVVQKDAYFKDLTVEQIDSLHMGCWIVATGVATLMSSGIINVSDEEITALIDETVASVIDRGTKVIFKET